MILLFSDFCIKLFHVALLLTDFLIIMKTLLTTFTTIYGNLRRENKNKSLNEKKNKSVMGDEIITNTHRTYAYTAAVQDDYTYWHDCDESDTSGKLMLVDVRLSSANEVIIENENINAKQDIDNALERQMSSLIAGEETQTQTAVNTASEASEVKDKKDKEEKMDEKSNYPYNSNYMPPIEIFFDDNIERDRAHIVDVRCSRTYVPVPFKISENVFIKKVEPYYAITDENYFIDLVEEMIFAQLDFREKNKN